MNIRLEIESNCVGRVNQSKKKKNKNQFFAQFDFRLDFFESANNEENWHFGQLRTMKSTLTSLIFNNESLSGEFDGVKGL